jgi:hypothetical protein
MRNTITFAIDIKVDFKTETANFECDLNQFLPEDLDIVKHVCSRLYQHFATNGFEKAGMQYVVIEFINDDDFSVELIDFEDLKAVH